MTEHSEIHFLSDPAPFREKERLYLEVRRREGRMLPDEVVRALPNISDSNPYAHEWRWRRRSFQRLLSFCKNPSALREGNAERTDSPRLQNAERTDSPRLQNAERTDSPRLQNAERTDSPRLQNAERTDSYRMTRGVRILDLGCGNGWMANRLAENPDWEVWAADVNEAEMSQGARLFGRKNLRFVYADIISRNSFPGSESPGTALRRDFDVAVLAASVQYFPDLPELIFSLKKWLKPGGEIHILDSPFYKTETERTAARQRTLEYYTKIGVPEMAAFYHHHLWADVEKLGGQNLNERLTIRFLQKIKWLAPFPWVRL